MRIGVFCSGGDSPGMNACVRAIVRTGIFSGHEIVGFHQGYQGIIDRNVHITRAGESVMALTSVEDIIHQGGTILHSSRSSEFRTDEGAQKAADNLRDLNIDALIPIGGDGTLRGAVDLARFWSGRIVGCPGTIDNDLLGTDYTIGFHTAVNTAVEAVDKLRDTAESHGRLFLVEVMGRHSGHIALFTALATGAAVACLPETETDVQQIIGRIRRSLDRGKRSLMVIVAEGDGGGVTGLHARLKEAGCPFSMRDVCLGHIQRGGSPVPADRLLGSRLGELAVQAILDGVSGVMAGWVGGKGILTPLPEVFAGHKPVPQVLVELLDRLGG
jgi:6-phosphofructokinase 1